MTHNYDHSLTYEGFPRLSRLPKLKVMQVKTNRLSKVPRLPSSLETLTLEDNDFDGIFSSPHFHRMKKLRNQLRELKLDVWPFHHQLRELFTLLEIKLLDLKKIYSKIRRSSIWTCREIGWKMCLRDSRQIFESLFFQKMKLYQLQTTPLSVSII